MRVERTVDRLERCDQLLAARGVAPFINLAAATIVFEANELGEQLVAPRDQQFAFARLRVRKRAILFARTL